MEYLPPRRRYLINKRAELVKEAGAIIEYMQSMKIDPTELERSLVWLKNMVRRLEEINNELERIRAELERILKRVPKLGLAQVRELLMDECEVWELYSQRFPRKPIFKTLHNLCKRAIIEFNRRDWDNAYYLLAEMYNVMVEHRQELEPIMARTEGRKDMFEVELDYIRQLSQWVSDMRFKGERLAGVEELRRWRR